MIVTFRLCIYICSLNTRLSQSFSIWHSFRAWAKMKRSSSGLSLVFIAFLCLAIATVSNFHSNEQTSLLYAQLIFFSNQQTLADPCYTTEGEIGHCTSVRSCYPKVKLPKLSNLKWWSTASLRGTCHYLENGKQVKNKNKIFTWHMQNN